MEGNAVEPKPRNKKKVLFFHKKRIEGKFELVSLTLVLDTILEHSSIESWEKQQTTGFWQCTDPLIATWRRETLRAWESQWALKEGLQGAQEKGFRELREGVSGIQWCYREARMGARKASRSQAILRIAFKA